MSSTGPVIPKRCQTLELKDLADIDDWEDQGETGEIYGFQLTADGRYVRKPIQNEDEPALSFNELRDVNTNSSKNGLQYFLKKQGNKWKLEPHSDIKWDIVYTFRSGYTFKKDPNIFRKSFNEGFTLISLVPSDNSKGNILLKAFKERHVLSKNIDSEAIVNAIPTIHLPKEFTLILELIASKPLKAVNTEIISGLTLSFKPADVTEDPIKFIISVQKNSAGIKTHASNDKMKLDASNFTKIDKINLSDISLIGFYLSNEALPRPEIELFTNTEISDN
jgi:hypothetical protein